MSPSEATRSNDARFILYHKQATSARTLFLRHASGSVVAPEALPPLSSVIDEESSGADEFMVLRHPAALVRELCLAWRFEPSLLQPEGEFHQRVGTPQRTLNIYLARFTTIDPPRELMQSRGASFCAITELRGGHPAEMALLRKAYETILGG